MLSLIDSPSVIGFWTIAVGTKPRAICRDGVDSLDSYGRGHNSPGAIQGEPSPTLLGLQCKKDVAE